MRKLEFKEQIVSAEERIKFEEQDRVVGVTIKNQGTNTVVTSFGSDGTINEILPLSSEAYGLPGYILTGSLKIVFSGAGTSRVILKIAYDKGEYCD